ncbi:MAG: GumC family protein [Halanaerobium sp.]
MTEDENYIVDEYEIDLREYMMILWHKKWLIIAFVIIAVLASYFLTARMERIYQSSTMMMVQSESGVDDIFSEQMSLGVSQEDKLINTYSQIFKSRRILTQVIEKLNLVNAEGDYINTGNLSQKISIQSHGDADLLSVQVEYNDPELAQKIADTLVSIMQTEIESLNQASLNGASTFIDDQLEETKNRLLELEDQLLKYRKEHELLRPETQGQNLLNRFTELEKQKTEAELLEEEAQIALREINQKLQGVDEKIINSESISRNPELNTIKSNLTSLYTELEGLKTRYTEKHPEIQTVLAKIDNLENQLNNKTAEIVSGRTETNNPLYQELNSRIINMEVQQVTASSQKEVYQERIAEIQQELDSYPEAELAFFRLQREKNVAEDIYLLLRNRKEEINIQQAMQTSDIFVVDSAYLPENPIRPNLKLNLAIASVLAAMLAVFIIFLLEFLDDTIKTEDDLEKASGLPVLGIIPDLDEIDHHHNYGEDE